MHVGIDLAPLNPPYTGIPNYIIHLVDAVLRASPHIRYSGFKELTWDPLDHSRLLALAARGGKLLSYQSSEFSSPENDLAPSWTPSVGWSTSSRRLIRRSTFAHSMATKLRGLAYTMSAGQRGIDLFHAFVYRAPGRSGAPILPVIYDLSHVRMPDMHPVSRVRWLDSVAAEATQARYIHTISEFTAMEIVTLLGVPKTRIRVIYPGLSPIYRRMLDPDPDIYRQLDLRKFEYAVTVSTLEPRKNLRTLVLAYMQLPARVRERIPLCIVGANGWGDLHLPSDVRSLERSGSIRFLGFLNDTSLHDLLCGARITLYPSLYEGFGIPIIEALACGSSLACSDAASMPEAAGIHATLINPLDVDAWAAEITTAADSNRHMDENLRSARRRHAVGFDWDISARQTLRLYDEIIA